MSAAMGVLQDLGYTTEETSAGQGVLSATKRRAGVFIRASLVIRPVASGQGYIARVSFQSINAMGMAESITDPNIYSQFFDRLSQSVFLEAHQI